MKHITLTNGDVIRTEQQAARELPEKLVQFNEIKNDCDLLKGAIKTPLEGMNQEEVDAEKWLEGPLQVIVRQASTSYSLKILVDELSKIVDDPKIDPNTRKLITRILRKAKTSRKRSIAIGLSK